MTTFTHEQIKKMSVACYLLEPPAPEVVLDCLDEIEHLRYLLQAGLDSANSEPDWFDWVEKVRSYLKGGE